MKNNTPFLREERQLYRKAFFDELLRRLRSGNISGRSADLAYHLLLAAIPMLLVFLQIASLVLVDPEAILTKLSEQLPDAATELVGKILRILSSSVSTSSIGIGIFVSLWTGSRGVDALLKHINVSLQLTQPRNPLLRRAISTLYTAVLLLLFILLLLLFVFSDGVINIMKDVVWLIPFFETILDWSSSLATRLLPLLVLAFVLILLYKAAPASANGGVTWREASVGGFFASVGIILTTGIYAFIMNNVSRMSLYLGSLTGILALLVWLLYVCAVLVMGAEVVAVFREIYRVHPSARNRETPDNK